VDVFTVSQGRDMNTGLKRLLVGCTAAACAVAVASLTRCSPTEPVEYKWPVDLLSPNGGEVFHVGDTVHIRWKADATRVSAVAINVSFDSCGTWYWYDLTFHATGYIWAGHEWWEDCQWVIPDSVEGPGILDTLSGNWLPGSLSTVSSQCLIAIVDYEGTGAGDTSHGVFSILPAQSAAKKKPSCSES